MNSQSWAKTVTQNRKKCERILSISKDIRYAGVFNEYGRTISGKIRPGVKPIFSPDSVRHEFFAIASMMRLREKTSKTLGDVDSISLIHKKILRFRGSFSWIKKWLFNNFCRHYFITRYDFNNIPNY